MERFAMASLDTSPGRHPWPKTGATPVLLRSEPTHYQLVEAEYLAEWEARVKEVLGVEVQVGRGLQTTSFCGLDPPDDCDSDILEV
jgi:hypothetical protein